MEGAIYQLKYLTERYDSLASEINEICSAHVMTMDVDEETPARFTYGGCDVHDGKLRIIFNEKYLGTNISDNVSEGFLFKALNSAPTDKALSFSTRLGIRSDYEPTIAETQQKIAKLLGKGDDEIKLNPNFEDTFAKLAEHSKTKGNGLREDWQSVLGSFTLKYFEAIAYQMSYIKVGEDELIQEGFLDVVSKLEFTFRIVDKLKGDSSYCEVEIDDGVLYLQCPAAKWGVNIDYIAEKLMDLL